MCSKKPLFKENQIVWRVGGSNLSTGDIRSYTYHYDECSSHPHNFIGSSRTIQLEDELTESIKKDFKKSREEVYVQIAVNKLDALNYTMDIAYGDIENVFKHYNLTLNQQYLRTLSDLLDKVEALKLLRYRRI